MIMPNHILSQAIFYLLSSHLFLLVVHHFQSGSYILCLGFTNFSQLLLNDSFDLELK